MKSFALVLIISFFSSSLYAGFSFCSQSNTTAKKEVKQEVRDEYCKESDLNYSKIMSDFNMTKKQVDKNFFSGNLWWGISMDQVVKNLNTAIVQRDKLSEVAGKPHEKVLKAKQEATQAIEKTQSKINTAQDKFSGNKNYGDYHKTEYDQTLSKCKLDGKDNKACIGSANKAAEIFADKMVAKEKEVIAKSQKDLEKMQLENKALANKLDKTKDKFKSAYEKRFAPYALKQFKDKNIEPAPKSIEEINKICFNTQSPPESDTLDVCKDLKKNADSYIALNKSIDDKIAEFDELKNPLDMLSLTMDNKLLKNDVAKNAIEEKIQKNLKGTVLGSMMDQVREDMCTVANNPSTMCSGQAFNLKSFVNDSGEIKDELIKKSASKFQNRSTATKN